MPWCWEYFINVIDWYGTRIRSWDLSSFDNIELIDFSNMKIKIIYCTKIYCFNKFFWKIIFQFFCQKVQCDSLYHKKEIRSQDIENGENNISFFFIWILKIISNKIDQVISIKFLKHIQIEWKIKYIY